MKRIRELPEFERSFKNSKNEGKPVMIVTVNRGPDENPRYEKTISCAVGNFGNFLVTNAPGLGAC